MRELRRVWGSEAEFASFSCSCFVLQVMLPPHLRTRVCGACSSGLVYMSWGETVRSQVQADPEVGKAGLER